MKSSPPKQMTVAQLRDYEATKSRPKSKGKKTTSEPMLEDKPPDTTPEPVSVDSSQHHEAKKHYEPPPALKPRYAVAKHQFGDGKRWVAHSLSDQQEKDLSNFAESIGIHPENP